MEALQLIGDLAVVMVIAGLVGWFCRRVGLSVVVGFLVAGIVIGPHTPPFQLVADLARVDMLAQLGLVFLVFSIGLGLSFARLKRLGFSIALATALGAFFMLNATRLIGVVLGWSTTESLFLAGMVVVSSSAIIAKVLEETNLAHERAGQLALGVTVLEDVVAVVMLTILTPLAQIEASPTHDVASTILRLAAFVVALLSFAILVVPRVIKLVERNGGPELRTLLLAGLVLGVAWLASVVGYSTALGAFIIGAVAAGTRHRVEIEKAFDTLKHIFGAVFFVAVGMLFDLELLLESYSLVLGTLVFVVVARPVATSAALVLVGQPPKEAIRAGLALTPIGEFSFIIAQLGVVAGVVPPSFYAVAVGLALGTAIIGPLLARHAEAFADVALAATPEFMLRAIAVYQLWLSQLSEGQTSQRLWAHARPRMPVILFQIVTVTTLLLVVEPAITLVTSHFGTTVFLANDVLYGSQLVLAVALLAPLVALWRNVTSVIFDVVMSLGNDATRTPMRRALLAVLKAALAVAMFAWVASFLPLGRESALPSVVVLALVTLVIVLFGRRVLSLHRWVEDELLTQFRQASNPALTAGLALPILDPTDEWNLDVDEVVLPPQSEHGGKRILDLALRKRFGCSIVGIDRQGVLLTNAPASEVLYPNDRLLLLGTRDQLTVAERFLMSSSMAGEDGSAAFNDLSTEAIVVADHFAHAGQSLAELNLIERFAVQVCGIRRGGERILVPHGMVRIEGGDQLLVLGTHDRIQLCRAFFATVAVDGEKQVSGF